MCVGVGAGGGAMGGCDLKKKNKTSMQTLKASQVRATKSIPPKIHATNHNSLTTKLTHAHDPHFYPKRAQSPHKP